MPIFLTVPFMHLLTQLPVFKLISFPSSQFLPFWVFAFDAFGVGVLVFVFFAFFVGCFFLGDE